MTRKNRARSISTLVVAFMAIGAIAASSADAAPMDYELTFDGTMAATFTLDPDLAAAAGISDVDVTAFDFSFDVSGYGLVEFDLGDITVNPPRGRFLDGELASMTTVGATGLLPDGSTFILDLTDFIPADASMIDLSMAGAHNLTIIDIGGGFPDEIGSFGIVPIDDGPGDPIPEPGAALLFAVGLLVLGRPLHRAR